MRTMFVGIFVLLTVGFSQAQSENQTQPSQNPGTTLQLSPTTPQREFSVDQLDLFTDQSSTKQRTFPMKHYMSFRERPEVSPRGPCYTMRAYMFSPGTESSAPQQTGYTTCVSSRTLQLRQTRPAAKFLPQ
jgi:hypothetical protein